jgi:hypothetical protein
MMRLTHSSCRREKTQHSSLHTSASPRRLDRGYSVHRRMNTVRLATGWSLYRGIGYLTDRKSDRINGPTGRFARASRPSASSQWVLQEPKQAQAKHRSIILHAALTCSTLSGMRPPTSAPTNETTSATKLTVSWNCRNFLMLVNTLRPHRTDLQAAAAAAHVRQPASPFSHPQACICCQQHPSAWVHAASS